MRRVERAGLATLAVGALAAWLAFPVLPTYDSLSSLVWGREILAGDLPGFAAFGAPTQHPLWLAVGIVLAPLGDVGARTMTLVTVASLVVLVAATYALGRTAFGPLAGALAGGLLLTRLDFGFYAAFAFVDIPFAALIVAAAALEAARPRRAGVVWVLLVLAGLMRPEGWLFAGAYGLWLWRDGDARTRTRIAVWVALAPALWVLTDLVVTGQPLFSWTYTSGEAEQLGRQREWYEAPGALSSALSELIKPPLLLLAPLGLALAHHDRRRLRVQIPLALLILGATAFTVVVLAGVSGQVPRYAAIAAVALVLFAGHLLARLLRVPAGAVARLAWAATLVLVLGGAAWTAAHLHPQSITALLRFRHELEDDLTVALRTGALRAGGRCGPVAVPTHKLVPAVRWKLDVARDGVVARNDPDAARAGAPGTVLLQLGTRLLTDPGYGAFGQQVSNSAASAQVPPLGFTRRDYTRYFSIYTRC